MSRALLLHFNEKSICLQLHNNCNLCAMCKIDNQYSINGIYFALGEWVREWWYRSRAVAPPLLLQLICSTFVLFDICHNAKVSACEMLLVFAPFCRAVAAWAKAYLWRFNFRDVSKSDCRFILLSVGEHNGCCGLVLCVYCISSCVCVCIVGPLGLHLSCTGTRIRRWGRTNFRTDLV